ncbi:MAG: pantoate--beta-alanine ligase [Planctomycetes bacterium]|nr:pantoate--beta-alanine ligase [Planctomycetota bacterium]MBI3834574.1 pantoate--beta-alanine ligase [Planctomycetota bacterium]
MNLMRQITEIAECREAVRSFQRRGQSVGLVLTMGALHAGHLSLIADARKRCDEVAVTIFVNPTQFGPKEDFSKYPRPLENDLKLCREAGAAIVFTPDVGTMYATDAAATLHVGVIGERLCGAYRPGHFDGVATVVCKLFNILPADAAFFGEKDYQQLTVIRRIVRDLNIPIEIVGCPTIREPDGLAMSSRNVYLSETERLQATSLSRALFAARAAVAAGEKDASSIVDQIRRTILDAGPASVDYIEVVDPDSLASLNWMHGRARICLAVRIGATRLIDNVEFQSQED